MNTFSLNGKWQLIAANVEKNRTVKNGSIFDITMPGDVHTALLEANKIKDPYFGKQELESLWVGRSDWTIKRTFNWEKRSGHTILKLTKVDTVATLYINDNKIGEMENEHQAYYFDVTEYLVEGENEIRFEFVSAETVAKERNKRLPYPIPHSRYPNDSECRNLVRKAQCNAGWDWGPCIMSTGIYEDIKLKTVDSFFLRTSAIWPTKEDESWRINVQLEIEAFEDCEKDLSVEFQKGCLKKKLSLKKGVHLYKDSYVVKADDIELWWPNGFGKQHRYSFLLTIGEEKVNKMVGFRDLKVSNEVKMGGKELAITVNGRPIFMKGANWIPQDAIPSRITARRYEKLIESMAQANMNMVRVWGGGLYEYDDFYNECDRLGILIWHDMMFACSTYPATPDFLASVEKEVRYQMRRLKDHPSIALWCGNNEDLGALTWYEESIANRDRYVVDYDRLNSGVLERVISEEDPDRVFWPSSPCAGPGDYSDNWHVDGNGDMHFWTVWHEGADFEKYHSVKPRFCSEFGYQSFPSFTTAKTFTPDSDFNLTSPTFEHHQKNPRGNSIIIENFARYFRFPTSFENMLYLSQAQQAWAIETAVVYWRSLMPYCMGTLIWQLNDVWPVSSWSSIEYSGKWKLLHYDARRFFSQLVPLLYIDKGKLFVYVANDTPNDEEVDLKLKFRYYDGKKQSTKYFSVKVPSMTSVKVTEISLSRIDTENLFCYAKLSSKDTIRERTIFLDKPKNTSMEDPKISYEISKVNSKSVSIKVMSEKPAFWVSLDADDIPGIFSDNFIAVRPTAEKNIIFQAENEIDMDEFKSKFKIYDLYTATH